MAQASAVMRPRIHDESDDSGTKYFRITCPREDTSGGLQSQDLARVAVDWVMASELSYMVSDRQK